MVPVAARPLCRRPSHPFFDAALKEKCGDPRTLSTVHSQLGIAYLMQKRLSQPTALSVAIPATWTLPRTCATTGVATAYSNAGMAFEGKHAYNGALQCFEKELQIGVLSRDRRLQAKSHSQIASCYQGAADAWRDQDDEAQAHGMCHKSCQRSRSGIAEGRGRTPR